MELLQESTGAVAAGCCWLCRWECWCEGGLAAGGAAGTSVGRTVAGREGGNRGGCGWKREGRKGAAADCCCVLSS